MKPGSSDRCKAKDAGLRCRRHIGHDGPHSAPRGKTFHAWTDPDKATA